MKNSNDTQTQSFYTPSISKPEEHVNELMNVLAPNGNTFATSMRQIISYYPLGERQCYLLHKGSVEMFRGSDGMVINSERAPFIFGLSIQMTKAENLFIRTQEICTLSSLPLEKANAIIAEHNLWESLAHLLVYSSSRIYEHCAKITQLTSYEIIRSQLIELANENPEIRYSTSIISYIMNRTFLSRSGVMRILAQLRSGGYITIENGILRDIKTLPLKY